MKIVLNITQDEALKRLSERINTDYSPERLMYGFGWSLDEIMYGNVDNNEFWIYDRSAFKVTEIYSCIRQLTGKISTEDGKTTVDYDFGYTKYNYYFFIFIYVAGIFLSLFSAGTVHFIGLTLAWAVAVSLTMGLGILWGKKYKQRVLEHFMDIFSDCIESIEAD